MQKYQHQVVNIRGDVINEERKNKKKVRNVKKIEFLKD